MEGSAQVACVVRPQPRRVRPLLASQIEPPRAITWRDVENLGRVRFVPRRGWCIEFRSVRWPGRATPRRVYVVQAPDYGRFDSEAEAIKTQLRIQARVLDGRKLHEVLSEYLQEVPENNVVHRWNAEFLPEQRRKNQDGELSDKRLSELSRYEARGHLEFWREVALHRVDRPMILRWVHWLRQQRKADDTPRLQVGAIRHLVADFGTFLRYEHGLGALQRMPQMPRIVLPESPKKVPHLDDVRRVLGAMAERKRGLWMARALAGLRPSEARRLDVLDYDFETGELRIPGEKSKTRKGRALPIRLVVPELDAWLVAHRSSAHGAAPLFDNPDAYSEDARWREHAERLAWAEAIQAAGVEYVQPNAGGRHAFATHEIGEGTDPYAVKDWLGHSTLKTTERYTKVTSVTLARRMRPPGTRMDPAAGTQKKESEK